MSVRYNLSNACTKTLGTGFCFGIAAGLICMGGLYHYITGDSMLWFLLPGLVSYLCGEWLHKKSMEYVSEVLKEVGE